MANSVYKMHLQGIIVIIYSICNWNFFLPIWYPAGASQREWIIVESETVTYELKIFFNFMKRDIWFNNNTDIARATNWYSNLGIIWIIWNWLMEMSFPFAKYMHSFQPETINVGNRVVNGKHHLIHMVHYNRFILRNGKHPNTVIGSPSAVLCYSCKRTWKKNSNLLHQKKWS